ncbi:MAG: hypothetical protein AAFN77_11815 [Planctomycetota bacterium]
MQRFASMFRRRFARQFCTLALTPIFFLIYFLSAGPAIYLMQTYLTPNPNDPLQICVFAFYQPLFSETQNPMNPIVDWYISKWVTP